MFRTMPLYNLFLNYAPLNRTLPKCIYYIIAYYSQAGQHYIGIINHSSNLLYIHVSSHRKPTMRGQKKDLSSYLSKQYFGVFCAMATLFTSITLDEKRVITFSNIPLSLADIVNYSWVSETVIATLWIYFEFVSTYFSVCLVHWRKRTIYLNRVAALIFETPS